VRVPMVVFVACTLVAGSAHAEDAWWGPDKRLHLAVSTAIPPLGFMISGNFLDDTGAKLAVGASLGLGLGAAKELVWDKAFGNGDPSWKDFAWDAVGTAAGVGLTWAVDRLVSSPRPTPRGPMPVPIASPKKEPAAPAAASAPSPASAALDAPLQVDLAWDAR
jgi:uncharacterized protein YfiM (DUF2279 family)